MELQELASILPNIWKARGESEKILQRIRAKLPELPAGVSVVINGSLARGEVTSQSDFDGYPLYTTGAKARALDIFDAVKKTAGLREFAKEGAFGDPVPADTIQRSIGGQGDDNQRFTRRMLLLLESSSVGDPTVYNDTLESTICRYISDDITDKQIGRFLLNDVIRFYRTMCVDFEFKTVEQAKPWGIRYTKLIFFRKNIYVSGIVMCAELAGLPAAQKRQRLRDLIDRPPIDRLLSVMGELMLPALAEYDAFLGALDDGPTRSALTKVGMLRSTHSDKFKQVKLSGHRYSSALVAALSNKYPRNHPIHEALMV